MFVVVKITKKKQQSGMSWTSKRARNKFRGLANSILETVKALRLQTSSYRSRLAIIPLLRITEWPVLITRIHFPYYLLSTITFSSPPGGTKHIKLGFQPAAGH